MQLTPELAKLYKKGADDPAFFVENVVGMTELWQKQKDIMYSVRDNPRTVVRSCNGAGKTFTSANVVSWFLATHPQSIVITTAPTARQVRELLWQEIRHIHNNSKFALGGDTTTVSWTMGAKWFALGLSTNEPDRFQGFHAEHILGVLDEACGIDEPIWEGMDAILTSSGARLLAIGNPTEPSGRFFNAFSSSLYSKIHISAYDTPNFQGSGLIYPALITPRWAEERKEEWGEESPAYQARILGEFPILGNDTMIPLGWVLRATERPIDYDDEGLCVVAADVARFGDDESVVAVRRGKNLVRMEVFHETDTTRLSREIHAIVEEEKPKMTVVDAVGIGAGVADNLRDWGVKGCVDFVSQGRAWIPEKFLNRRAEAWYRVRELFRTNEINIPKDDRLTGQLSSPKYQFTSSGAYQLEAKEQMKKRGLPSPDRADAVVMAFDCDGNLDNYETQGNTLDENKPGTVGALLSSLIRGEESEEFQWSKIRLGQY